MSRRNRRNAARLDTWTGEPQLGDGGLAIVDDQNVLVQLTPAKATASVRYLLARLPRDHRVVPERIAFTSALSGEGVSYVARAFAAVLAHDTGRRVCLVDLNWWSFDRRRYRASDELHGLYEVLWNHKPLDEVLVPTLSPELWLLPAGSAPVATRPMLARHPQLGETLDALAAQFDHLVIDLPAILPSSDALALCEVTDGVVLVVQQGVANRAQVGAALNEVPEAKRLGIALNQVKSSVPRRVRRLLAL